MMPDLSQRSSDIEIMDDLNCSGEVVDQTLRELETINTLLGGNHVTIDGLHRLIKQSKTKGGISVADLGCGGGDMLRLIRRWSQRHNLALRLMGIDANPNIVAFAQRTTRPSQSITYATIDIFSDEFAEKRFDIILGTLFFHHFTNDQLAVFFRQLKGQVSIGFVINDIHRHWFAYYSIKWLTRLLSRSPMVKFDAPLSVRRAFRKSDLLDIMKRAGIEKFSIRWMWAFRWQVVVHTAN